MTGKSAEPKLFLQHNKYPPIRTAGSFLFFLLLLHVVLPVAYRTCQVLQSILEARQKLVVAISKHMNDANACAILSKYADLDDQGLLAVANSRLNAILACIGSVYTAVDDKDGNSGYFRPIVPGSGKFPLQVALRHITETGLYPGDAEICVGSEALLYGPFSNSLPRLSLNCLVPSSISTRSEVSRHQKSPNFRQYARLLYWLFITDQVMCCFPYVEFHTPTLL